jgi:4'-phosphopantetheinyl transferase EntD
MRGTPCAICRTVHGPKQAHRFPKTLPPVTSAPVTPIAKEAERQVSQMANARTRDAAALANVDNSPTTYRHRDAEKRRAYMRALMAGRRAARRALRAGGKA